MRDIPMFTTDNGVASLILKQVPHKQEAYIRIQDATEPNAFLQECVQMCTQLGAEQVYATGHRILSGYPVYAQLIEMVCRRNDLPETDAKTVPVEEKYLERWRNVYNEKMANVPASAYISFYDAKEYLNKGYYILKDDRPIGIGVASKGVIEAVAALVPGGGRDSFLALAATQQEQLVRLEVAEQNDRALALYKSLGFTESQRLTCWYKII